MSHRRPLDRLDWKILEALQEDARMSLTSLGKSIGLSQPAMSERVQKLVDQNVIQGFRAIVDPAAVGMPITAIIRLKTGNDQIRRCVAFFETCPQIVEAHRVTGEDCFVLKVVTVDTQALENIADDVAKFGPITTSLVYNSYASKPISKSITETR